MDARTVQKRFLRINKTLGTLSGMWPYQDGRIKLVERFVSVSIMFSAFFTQMAYIILFPSVNVAVNGVPFYVVVIGTFVKMGNSCINETKVKTLLSQIFNDWATIKSKEEHYIMTSYSERGALITLGYFLHLFVTALFLATFPMVAPILDLIVPLNESRKRIFIYPAHYWLDYDKHYILIMVHMMIISGYVCIIFCACDTNYIYSVQHACGLLAVTKHRFVSVFKNLPSRAERSDVESLNRVKYRNVCQCIQAHQRALKYLELIENSHHTYLFISMGMLITSLSISLLKVAGENQRTEWFLHCMFLGAQLFHVFVLTVQGQFVINSLQELYDAIYESPWYQSSPKTQALFVLVLRSCLNPPLLTAGGLITLNLRSFAEIVKASVSYYTVMQTK